MTIAVLGGAGYIGSHTVARLVEAGEDVIVIDNLVTGHKGAINPKARFYQGDVRDRDFLRSVFKQEQVDGIVHFAASSIVPESMRDPLKYFDNNTYGMIALLEVMNEFNVKTLSSLRPQPLMANLSRSQSRKRTHRCQPILMAKVSSPWKNHALVRCCLRN